MLAGVALRCRNIFPPLPDSHISNRHCFAQLCLLVQGVVCRGNVRERHTSHVTRHTSHATRHTSHATRHTSHVTRHTSHVTRHTSHATRHTPHTPFSASSSALRTSKAMYFARDSAPASAGDDGDASATHGAAEDRTRRVARVSAARGSG
jgi:hypothetical protein